MPTIKIKVNDESVETEEGRTILQAARDAEIYIPSLCAHPDLPPLKEYGVVDAVYHGADRSENDGSEHDEGCRLCMVDVGGDIVRACSVGVKDGMVVKTDTDEVVTLRKANLLKILEHHPHACLTCAQQEGCTREPCSTNVPVNERCCIKFGNCEVQKVSQYIGIPETTPKWIPTDLPKVDDEPIFFRDYNLCIGCARCVRACNDVRGINALGMLYSNGDAVVGSVGPTLKESECKFCGACVEVCPTGALLDKTTTSQFDIAKGLAPCTAGCPVNIDIPRYTRLIAEGNAGDALAVIREKVPFPRVLGRICMHPCEDRCRRGDINNPIAICALKRYVAEMDHGKWKKAHDEKKAAPTGKKVAVIGSGPAGLTAAFYLAKSGHSITVFESEPKPGGMLANTIPLYRLPEDVLGEDLEVILSAGDIEVRTHQALGTDFTMADLESGGYDATFLAVGLQKSRMIELEGIDSNNVVWGLDFLKQIRSGERTDTGKNVVVIGGGNVAVDVARTAKRLGAEKVTMVCLETREEMPAHEWEIAAAEEEDIEVQCSWGPTKILTDSKDVKGIELKRCTSVFDSAGKFCPEYNGSDTSTIDGDTVILAVGQGADLSFIDESMKDLVNDKGMIKVNLSDLKTSRAGVYAGGDAVSMPGTVIDAIKWGRIAAAQINSYLGAPSDISEILVDYRVPTQHLGREEGFYDRTRTPIHMLDKENRKTTFHEVELTYDDSSAKKEASRCLQCDLRLLFKSNPMPPELYIAFTEAQVQAVSDKEGVFQLMDENKEVLEIKGAMNLRQELTDQLGSNENAKYFIYEEDPMYTQRESELLQQYMQKHGRMPGSDADDDDLF